jgi:hypothetical protein
LIRVLLARMPRLLRDILTDRIGAEADMELVGFVEPVEALAARIGESAADVVVVGTEPEEATPVWREVLARHPYTKLLAIEGVGRTASLYELRPTRTRLGEASPTSVAEWIRRAVRPVRLATRAGQDSAFEEAGDDGGFRIARGGGGGA